MFTVWVDGIGQGDLGWLTTYFRDRLRPAVIPVCAPPNPDTGVWDFKVADAIAPSQRLSIAPIAPMKTISGKRKAKHALLLMRRHNYKGVHIV
jgi:hypothetical protein